MMEIYGETYIKSHFSKVALTQASRCSQRKTPLLPENFNGTQRHERCHNTGNDLMTSNVKPAFGSLYICMFRPSEQSFLRLQLSVLHYHTVHFLFNLLSLSTFLSQQTLLDDLWKNLHINSWFNFITNVFVCVQRLFLDQHCLQVVNFFF